MDDASQERMEWTMKVAERPHDRDEGYVMFDEQTLIAEQGGLQFQADMVLNRLASLVHLAQISSSDRAWLLCGIWGLRDYIHDESRRMLAEPQGRCN
jgi:hypothetical protein